MRAKSAGRWRPSSTPRRHAVLGAFSLFSVYHPFLTPSVSLTCFSRLTFGTVFGVEVVQNGTKTGKYAGSESEAGTAHLRSAALPNEGGGRGDGGHRPQHDVP